MYTLRSEGTDFSDDIVRICQDLNNFVRPFPYEGVERDFFRIARQFHGSVRRQSRLLLMVIFVFQS